MFQLYLPDDPQAVTLKPVLTDEFLATLTLVGKTIGWGMDYVEIEEFINTCYSIAGKDAPDLTPFEE